MQQTLTTYAFTGLGVLMLYARWGKAGLRYYVPRDFMLTLHLSDDRKSQIELVIFLIIGTVVANAVVEPHTARQAIAAGLGWTGLLASPNSRAK